MTIEVKSVTIDSKAQTVTIVGTNFDGLINFDLDSEPNEVEFRFDWSEGIGPKVYLSKILQKQSKKHPDLKTFGELIESLPGNVIFLNNNFIWR